MEPQVKTGVGVIVIKGNKVLVGRRKGSHGEGLLAFPGGSFDPTDDSIYGCAEREVWEECRMTCRCISPDGVRQELFTTFDILSEDGLKRFTTLYVLAEYGTGGKHFGPAMEFVEPVEPEKCERWEWLTMKELNSRIITHHQETWIPIDKVIYYLNKIRGEF